MGHQAKRFSGMLAIAAVATLACALPARADEPLAAARQGFAEDPRLAADWSEPSSTDRAREAAAPSGRIVAGDAQLIGPARYALRSKVGSASVITFVATPPRVAFDGPGTAPEGMPLNGRLSSQYGLRTHPILGGTRFHDGVDLAAPAGTPIRATSDGVVERAAWTGGYGLMVEVNHGQGTETLYGHMERMAVSAGQSVKKGDVLGYVGSTGLSTGPHLHYEVRQSGHAVNPLHR